MLKKYLVFVKRELRISHDIPIIFMDDANFAKKIAAFGEISDKKYRIKEVDTKDFWMPILKQKSFREFVEKKYKIAMGSIMQHDDIDEAFDVETMNGE